MFFDYKDSSVRYTGRFGEYNNTMTATTPGAYFEVAFKGDYVLLRFEIGDNEKPLPHLWVSLDGGDMFETAVDSYLRVNTKDGDHVLKVIYKGGQEAPARFTLPLRGKISFLGYEADDKGVLEPDTRKTIEIVGDSITEGVFVDEHIKICEIDQHNRPYQDDACANYAYLTAQNLNLREFRMGYGAAGATRGGWGGVPKAVEAYPFCFEGCPVGYGHPDYILINHGANDRGATAETYVKEYRALLELVRKTHPDSMIISLSAFCVAYPNELKAMIDEYNKETGDEVKFIDGGGWVEPVPLHPTREGHKIIAEKLTAELKKLGL